MSPVVSKLRVHFRCAFVALVTLVGVTGCSHVLEVRLFSNTAGPIVLHVFVLHGYHSEEKDIVVEGGGLSAPFVYPRTLRMSASGCEFMYRWPKPLQGYPLPLTSSYDVTLPVQGAKSDDSFGTAWC
jgi:hypothetical protein